jgi:hypothetical protein
MGKAPSASQSNELCVHCNECGCDEINTSVPLVAELPEHDVEDLDGLLRRVRLPPGDELPEVVEVGARCELDGHPVLPLPAVPELGGHGHQERNHVREGGGEQM